MSLYDQADIERMQNDERDVQLATAQRQSVGGYIWLVERNVGDGINEPANVQTVAPVTGWVFRYKPPTVRVNGALFQPDDEWRIVGADNPTVEPEDRPGLQQHDRIEAAADAQYSYQVMTVEQRAGYFVCVLEQTA